jgi:serine protease DegQ
MTNLAPGIDAPADATASRDLSDALANAVAAVAPSVVHVPRRRGGGSGTVVAPDLVLGSNFHTPDQTTLLVADASGELAERAATVVGRDPGTDLALLRVDGGGLTPVTFADPADLRVGQLALALARPGRAVRASLRAIGVLGGPFRSGWGGAIDRYIETDRELPRGFAGGPLVTVGGQVIGVGTRTLVRGADLAIPPATLARVIAALRDHGRVARGYLGVGAVPARLADRRGALIASLEPDGPAAAAGLLVGDVITAVGDREIDGPRALAAALWDAAGATRRIDYQRGGHAASLEVTIGSRA